MCRKVPSAPSGPKENGAPVRGMNSFPSSLWAACPWRGPSQRGICHSSSTVGKNTVKFVSPLGGGFVFLFRMVYHRILNIVPCAVL